MCTVLTHDLESVEDILVNDTVYAKHVSEMSGMCPVMYLSAVDNGNVASVLGRMV